MTRRNRVGYLGRLTLTQLDAASDPPTSRATTAARALVVADGYAMWHNGILDTVTGRFAYHTFHRNERVARIAQPADIIRTEVADAR